MAEPQAQSATPNAMEAVDESGQRRTAGALALMLALFALALLLVFLRHRPTAARPAGAPATEFSAGRAGAVLRALAGNGRTHGVGTAADARVRQVIVSTLSGLGYQPLVEEGFACHWGGNCGRVRNVVARLAGREPGPAVAVVAHYDSVDAGPGVSDDLAGVAAILEIGRALKAAPPPRHPVLLLLDEGEEAGLLGATAFEESSPEAGEVRAVVNLEARGTGGPSYMFETSGDNAWMISAWAPRVPRPVTTSLAAAIYAQLPNDTDLTEFRNRRVPGLNFAFIGDATRYHTPADNLANASMASLQHQGECALAAVDGLANSSDLASPPRGDLAFFDLFGLGVVRWPVGWTLAMSVAGLLLVLAVALAALAGGALRGRELALGLLTVPATLLATAVLAWGLVQALQAIGALAGFWLAHPLPALAAFWLLPLAVAAALAAMLGTGRRSSALGLWAGVWIVWAVLGLVLSLRAPATSYIFVLPALVAGLCALLARPWRVGGDRRATASPAPPAAMTIVPGVAAAVIWWGVLLPLYAGLGVPALLIIAALLAVLYATFAPLVPVGGGLGRRLWVAALVLAVLAALTAAMQPRSSPGSPQAITYTFYQDGDSGAARWVVRAPRPLPAAVRQAATFGPPSPAFPWSSPAQVSPSAPAPPVPATVAPPPELRVVANDVAAGKRHLRLHLTSRRGALIATVWVPARSHPEQVSIEGHPVPTTGWRLGGPHLGPGDWVQYSDVTLPPGGCDVEMTLGDTGPVEIYAVDLTPGLPPAGAALLAARSSTAVPQHLGDLTMVSRKLKL
jgi:Peptidase family M28